MAPQDSTDTNAVDLILTDHKTVRLLFDQYHDLSGDAGDATQREELAQQICKLVTAHANLEEELFYPAARQALGPHDLLDESAVEHATARDLIEQIQGMDPSEELYDAKVKVLGEYVQHHVEEEENELIPLLQKEGSLDFDALGQQMMVRKQELMSELGVQEPAA